MFKKQYGLVYIRGTWYVKNYRRVLKNGGLGRWSAWCEAWLRNRKGEKPKINLKRIVARPGPQGDYQSLTTNLQEESKP